MTQALAAPLAPFADALPVPQRLVAAGVLARVGLALIATGEATPATLRSRTCALIFLLVLGSAGIPAARRRS